jgi:hypothetical protein
MSTAPFSGPERRRHKLYVTRNSEYHVRDGRVIAVRERRRRVWVPDHRAIGMLVRGRIRPDSLVPHAEAPCPGDRMYLCETEEKGPRDLVTSMVLAVERPPREVVAEYAMLAA